MDSVKLSLAKLSTHLQDTINLIALGKKAEAMMTAKHLHTEAATLRSLLEEKQ